jgi:hypothetical protein
MLLPSPLYLLYAVPDRIFPESQYFDGLSDTDKRIIRSAMYMSLSQLTGTRRDRQGAQAPRYRIKAALVIAEGDTVLLTLVGNLLISPVSSKVVTLLSSL